MAAGGGHGRGPGWRAVGSRRSAHGIRGRLSRGCLGPARPGGYTPGPAAVSVLPASGDGVPQLVGGRCDRAGCLEHTLVRRGVRVRPGGRGRLALRDLLPEFGCLVWADAHSQDRPGPVLLERDVLTGGGDEAG